MGRGRAAARPGARWRPALSERRMVGRRSLRVVLPKVRMPRLAAYWRQVGLLVAAACVAGAGGWWLFHSPLLTIHSVGVEGNTVLSDDVVRDVAELNGASIMRPDFAAAEERLVAQPLIKEADVGRDWPNGATVHIVERTAWGVWQAGTERFVVDAEGIVLNLPAPPGAPVIVQTDVTLPLPDEGERVDIGAVRVAQELVRSAEQTLGRPVVALEFSRARGLTAVLDGDLRVTFGDAQGYEFKLAALFSVLRRADEEGRPLRSVDLRFGDRVAVQ